MHLYIALKVVNPVLQAKLEPPQATINIEIARPENIFPTSMADN
jgi:hypothetical protein